MEILKKNELKKEFFKLTKKLSDAEAMDVLIEKINSEDYVLVDFSGVYVYMGAYKFIYKSKTSVYPLDEILVTEDDSTAECKLFFELDSGLLRFVDIKDELETFEKKNKIVYIPNVRNYQTKSTFIKDFKKLQKAYFLEMFTNNEESAVNLVTSEEFIKQLFSLENYMERTENDKLIVRKLTKDKK